MQRSIQIGIPASKYGTVEYFLPWKMSEWVEKVGAKYSYCGHSSSGNGYTDGIPNTEYTFMIYTTSRDDASAFKMLFPECRVIVCE